MIDDELEARLARWRPRQAPPGLMRRLYAAAPAASAVSREPGLRWRAAEWFAGSLCRPWSLAYAGLLTAWALILVLRLLTPGSPLPVPAESDAIAQTGSATGDSRVFAGTLAAERTFFLTRNNLDQP